jgi:Predicted nucleoside-diphosphate-sugar epimerase
MEVGKLGYIRVLSDGRPGHENQSVGLALALARRTGATHEVVKLDPKAPVWARMRAAAEIAGGAARPQLVIAAGHRTHLPLWWAARRFRARSVVIMKPSLPAAFFDLALVPRHDVADDATDTARRVLTRGALNRVPEDLPAKEARGLVLIGGPSKHHGWDGAALAPMIARVIAARPDLEWIVGDSRRTPGGFLRGLETPPGVRVTKVPHQETKPGWLADELARAALVWVTADSVSMVHEALTAGAATGVLPVSPAKKGGDGGRPARAIAGLVAAGLAAEFPAQPTAPATRFHEAARCAELILARWFGAGVLSGGDAGA